MVGLVKPSDSIYAAVFHYQPVGTSIDLLTPYADGSFVTYSTSEPTWFVRRDDQAIVRHPELSADELYHRMLAERPQGPFLPVSSDQFPSVVERYYAQEQSLGGDPRVRSVSSRQRTTEEAGDA